MVRGCGLMASAFVNDYENDNNFIIFAAGVSNSLETNISDFNREEDLLIKTLVENKDKHIRKMVFHAEQADRHNQRSH